MMTPTQDEIIEMARQAGFLTNEIKSYVISPYTFEDQDLYEEIEAFAKLVAAKERERIYFETSTDFVKSAVAAEREACAKLVEVSDDLEDWEIICGSDGRELLNAMANAIRARGEA